MTQHCSKCQRRKVIDYHAEPAEAWKVVTLNRWPMGKLCASCFDVEPEKAKVQGGISVGLSRPMLIAIFALCIAIGAGWAWLIKLAFGL